MKTGFKYLMRFIYAAAVFMTANAYFLRDILGTPGIVAVAVFFLFINLRPSPYVREIHSKRLRGCQSGCELLRLFLISLSGTIVFLLAGLFKALPAFFIMETVTAWVLGILLVVLVENIVFWNGIIRVYTMSAQLGIKWRVVGILCGWIPIAHLIVLCRMIQIVTQEVVVENNRILHDEARRDAQICATKYPILMVHGVFFRDFRYLNYWGRIPKELEKNGACIYYGNHQSAASVADSGKELAARIRQIVEETSCGKVNLIAHSKGGLDCRCAIGLEGVESYVASLTTINTPHRGCEFADYLLSKIPSAQKEAVAKAYNAALLRLGDEQPDFLAAVGDLTAEACRARNEKLPKPQYMFCQSVGSCLKKASCGRFPLNLTHKLVKYFDGENDGLVGSASFAWGDRYTYLSVKGDRGISHGDMIDLNRENLPEFDVPEFYVQLVHDLQERGM